MSDDKRVSPLPGLRSALVTAASRQDHADQSHRAHRHHGARRRPGPWIVGVAAALAVIGVATSLFVAPAEAGITANRSGDVWIIEVHDASMPPRAVEMALRRQGVDTTVTAAPVGPSRVGQFITTSGVELVGADTSSSATVRVPADRPVNLDLGRPARPGETYAAPSDAYAAGEPLECSGVWGRPVGDLLSELEARSLAVQFLRPGGKAPSDAELVAGVVTDALMASPDRLIAYITDHARSGFAHAPSRGSERCPVGGTR